MEDLTEFIIRWLPDGTHTFVNEAYCRYCGQTREELVGLSFFPYLLAEDREYIERQIASLSPDNPVVFSEYQTRRPDRKLAWQQWTDRGIFDDDGNLLEIQSVGRDITDHKETAEALRATESTAKALLNASPDLTLLAELDGTIVAVNDAAIKQFGRSEAELVGTCAFDMFPPDVAKSRMEYAQEVARTCEPVQFEDHRAGRWFENHLYPVLDDQGNVTQVAVVARDVTELKQAEESLRASEENYRNVYDTAPLAFVLWDTDGRITGWNDHAEKIFGWSRQEALGKNLLELLVPEYLLPRITEVVDGLVRGQIARNVTNENLTKSGRIITCEWNSSVRFDGSGNVVGAISLALDITQRVKAEAEARAILQTSSDIVKSIPSGLCIYQYWPPASLKLIEANPAAIELTGIQVEKFIGKEFDVIWPSAKADGLTDHLLAVMETGKSFETKEYSYEDNKLQGAFRIRAFRMPNQCLGVAFENITEQKLAEREAAKLEEQLLQAQKMEAIGRLTGGIAHDFNNLLTPILGYSELLIGALPAGDSQYEELDEIRKAASRARDLTRRLLAFGRRQALEVRALDLNDVVGQCHKMLSRVIKKNVEIEVSPLYPLGSVKADPAQIEQVLLNLVINANDAMPDGGNIQIATDHVVLDQQYALAHPGATAGPHVLISVADTGCGMDANTLAKVFEPFFTTKRPGEGTGLGLATAHGIIKQHGGSIDVTSEPGVGTTFNIYLPKIDEEPETVSDASPKTSVTGGSESILVVEDDERVRRLTCTALGVYGYEVQEAASPSQAIAIFETREESFDLLVSDVVLPEMNGPQLFERLTKLRPGLKVLFMSGYAGDAIAKQGIIEAGTNFIHKPFSIQKLAEKIREALES